MPEVAPVRRDAGEWVLPVVSLVVILAYSLLVLVPSKPGPFRGTLVVVIGASWISLIGSFVVRLARAPAHSRREFVRLHSQDLAAAIFPLLGVFSPLRQLHRLRGFRGQGGNALRSRLGVRAALYTVTFVYIVALTELAVERDAPGATIRTFGNAIWWSCVTIATVGYGDFAPVTPLGRLVAIALMVGGVAIIGTTSALIVSYVSERIHASAPPEEGRPEDSSAWDHDGVGGARGSRGQVRRSRPGDPMATDEEGEHNAESAPDPH